MERKGEERQAEKLEKREKESVGKERTSNEEES